MLATPRHDRAGSPAPAAGQADGATAGRRGDGDPYTLSPDLYRRVCGLVREQAGIQIRAGKEAQVDARISKRARTLHLPSIRSYLKYLEEDSTGEELLHFVDAMTTNFTRFFREPEHFEDLRRLVSERARAGQTQLKLWSAAASTGQEPYSMAMALKSVAETHGVGVRILATDISTRALGVAREALYPDVCLADVPLRDRRECFVKERGPDGKEGWWRVVPQLRAWVRFDRVNLARPPFPMKGPFDAIFCRNVMIYLDAQVRVRLVGAIERLLRPGGLLIIGHAETLTGITSALTPIRPSVFQR